MNHKSYLSKISKLILLSTNIPLDIDDNEDVLHVNPATAVVNQQLGFTIGDLQATIGRLKVGQYLSDGTINSYLDHQR